MAKSNSSGRSSIFAGVLGGVAFAALLILFGNMFWAIAGGAAAFAAGLLVSAPRKKKEVHQFQMYGISRSDLLTALRDGGIKVRELRSAISEIKSSHVKKKANAVVSVAERILADIENDPKDLRRARQFLNYYLDATVKIVKRYVSLSNQGVTSPDIEQSMKKVESILDTLKSAFEKQLALLLEDDVMDLEAEVEVLERTIKMEGLAEDEG